MTGNAYGKQQTTEFTVCVASRSWRHRKTGKRRCKKLLYAVWKVRLTPRRIREAYRKRFGIETSYRQMNEARIRTCTRDPRQRLLFVAIALVLRNVWVWLHFQLARNKSQDEPLLFPQLLRFKAMLQWITQVIQWQFGTSQEGGIKYQTYQHLMELKQ